MKRDTIAELEIDAAGRLHVTPSTETFPYIYREAMEINWDPDRQSLYSPAPREWWYSRWLQQILGAAAEQGCVLQLSTDTGWQNIDPGLKAELVQVFGTEA